MVEMDARKTQFERIQSTHTEPGVCVCSLHPIAAQMLKDALEADGPPGFKTRLPMTWHDLAPQWLGEVLLLDGCGQVDWPKLALHWEKIGGKVVVLFPEDSAHPEKQLRALFLGVSGVVVTSTKWQGEILQAVRAVIDGGLWIRRDVLNEYVRRTSGQSRSKSREFDALEHLTAREEQIMGLLLRGDSNKEIGNALGISERTVKYHVSNILQKSQVSSRRELLNTLGKDEELKNLGPLPTLDCGPTENESRIS